MGDTVKYISFVWETIKCLDFETSPEFYYGSDYNGSGVLRFTNLIYNAYYDCGFDTDLLRTFSKNLNLRLVFIKPNKEDTGKLGTKVNDKWFNGSMALLHENKADYLSDDTFNNPEIYYDIKTTPVIEEVYQFSFAMKKLSKSYGFHKFFNQLELPVWITFLVSLIIVIVVGALNAYYVKNTNKSNFKLILMRSMFYIYETILSKSGVSQSSITYFGQILFIFWIFSSSILSESYKSVTLSNIVHEPKIWYKNIKELAESEANFDIYIPEDTLTFNLLLEHSKSNSEDSIYWERLLNKVKLETFSGMQGFDKLMELCSGGVALIYNSLKGRRILPFKSECDLSINELKYDGMNVIRLIRKDYEYSDQIISISNALIESGIDRLWESLEQQFLPLIVRYHDYEFKRETQARNLSFNDLSCSTYLLIIGFSLASISLVIELLNNKTFGVQIMPNK